MYIGPLLSRWSHGLGPLGWMVLLLWSYRCVSRPVWLGALSSSFSGGSISINCHFIITVFPPLTGSTTCEGQGPIYKCLSVIYWHLRVFLQGAPRLLCCMSDDGWLLFLTCCPWSRVMGKHSTHSVLYVRPFSFPGSSLLWQRDVCLGRGYIGDWMKH